MIHANVIIDVGNTTPKPTVTELSQVTFMITQLQAYQTWLKGYLAAQNVGSSYKMIFTESKVY